MNHIVLLDANSSELEKILSGTKSMVIKECDPAWSACHPVSPGDSLYFLRNKDESTSRVKGTVVRVLFFTNRSDDDLSQLLKEMQPKLQLTEDQYNDWSARQAVLFVEFEAAHKIPVLHVAPERIKDRSNWIAFRAFSEITE